ncbi:MAG: 50S ribosomal protein L3 N(5)-glutamine methyltransferase [Candidatus Accumulibacter sp.]|jgi:ribosomal protein L3 glutamine methyltransferase|nr:50S ribosomal protein L3 N(5)-glutamine methyltransferase [Accumulibacter sp.]
MYRQARSELSTLRDLIRFAVSRFSEAKLFFGHGTDNAWDEAIYLLLHALHLPHDRFNDFIDARLVEDERERALKIIERRVVERLPAAYLTKEAWIGDYRFFVDERAIIPRSHIGELLHEQLAPWVNDPWAIHNILDLCTGSGCLAIIATLAFPEARVDAVDISEDALAIARENVKGYKLKKRMELIRSDLFSALDSKKYDLIIANPPYVDAETMASLPQEYLREPEIALAGGDDGLKYIRIIVENAAKHLKPKGLLVVEAGNNFDAMENAYPNTPFIWLDTAAGSRSVFLLKREDLPSKS